jgi:signal transduction histidine kinase
LSLKNLNLLAAFIRQERASLLAEWRLEVRQLDAARDLDVPTLNDHLPDLLEELACELELCGDETMIEGLRESPVVHGLERLRTGFDVEEVVAEYNALRSVIQNLAERHGLSLDGRANHIVNRVIDGAIGLAVKTYATQKALEVQQRRSEHLSFIVHDLKTPLSVIGMAARLLEASFPAGADGERPTQLLATLHRNVGRLNALVQKVVQEEANLKTDSLEELKCEEFLLRDLVDSLASDLQPLAETLNAKLENQTPAGLTVFADAGLLTLVFQNLISNSLNYSPNGEVVIGAKQSDDSGIVECWVTDNGAGIPAERLELVFEKLETDPARKEGMGLGLAIVKQIVEGHGGQVTVESKVGYGSTFRFTVPAGPVAT